MSIRQPQLLDPAAPALRPPHHGRMGNFISVLIAKGDSESDIPNVADLEQLNGVYVAYDKMGTANDSGTLVTPSFEVTETTDVVIGFLTSLAKGNSYFKVTELKLILE